MKKSTVFLLLFLLYIFAFSNVKNINNPHNGKWNMDKKFLWKTESAGDEVFGDVQSVVTSSDGKVFVADMKNSLIFIFNENGKFIRSFGKKGEGPGEIREYFGGNLFNIIEDRVIFADRTMFHYFDTDGNYLKTVPFSPRLKPREFVNKDVFISAAVTVDRRRSGPEKILLFNLRTDKKVEITSFRPFDNATDTQESGGNQVTVGIVIGDITPMMLVKYHDQKIYYGMNNKSELNVCDLNGNKVLAFSNTLKKPNRVSRNYKNELKKSLGDIPKNILDNIIDSLPPYASFFSSIHIDQKGNIYLVESNPDSENIKHIDIYNGKGKYICRTEIRSENEESIKYIHFSGNFMFLVTEDEDGNVVLSKYRIELP